MTMVAGVQVCLGSLNISRSPQMRSADIPLAQTLRRVVISTRCSVASRDPSSKVWNANSLKNQLAHCLRYALADLNLCSSSESMMIDVYCIVMTRARIEPVSDDNRVNDDDHANYTWTTFPRVEAAIHGNGLGRKQQITYCPATILYIPPPA
jgi:hypothetical protein